MPDAYHQLLDAAIAHLQTLKSRGIHFVSVQRDALLALNRARTARPRPGPARPADPAPAASLPATRASSAMAGRGDRVQSSGAMDLFETQGDFVATGPSPEARAASPPSTLQEGVPAPTAASGISARRLDSTAKVEAMKELRERALVCVKCPNLARTRKNVVFGVGSIDAALMFVGEAPGVDEDAQGEPFVGAAGQLLTKIIQAMGLSRQTVFIANILKCRPDTPSQSTGNRKPTADEMKTCIPYLHSQIDLIRPRVLVALGATAVDGLLGKTEGITRLRGRWQEFRGIPLMPTFHPSYLLRNQALAERRKVWEDMMKVMERLEMEISEKQRGYFLSR